MRWPSRRQAEFEVLGRRFQGHPAVRAVKLVPAARSMTVFFDPAYRFQDIARTLPAVAQMSFPPSVDASGLDWTRIIAAGLPAVLPLGPFAGVAVSVVGSLAGQLREGRRLLPAPRRDPARA